MDCVGGRCAHVYMAVPCATGTDGPFLASSLAACIGLIGLPTTGQADDPSQSDVSYISIVLILSVETEIYELLSYNTPLSLSL